MKRDVRCPMSDGGTVEHCCAVLRAQIKLALLRCHLSRDNDELT
jgi:hypothetical protein